MVRALRERLIAALAAIVGAVILVTGGSDAARATSATLVAAHAPPPVPPTPKVAATRVGARVRITYSFAVWPRNLDRRPVLLLTSVKASEPRYSPYMKRHRISSQKGTPWQPLGLGSAPFKLFAAAYSRLGRSSPTVSTRVTNG